MIQIDPSTKKIYLTNGYDKRELPFTYHVDPGNVDAPYLQYECDHRIQYWHNGEIKCSTCGAVYNETLLEWQEIDHN